MSSPAPPDITALLHRWSAGDRQALDQLIPIVYQRLRQLAHHRLRVERDGCSLDTTGLVHEAYLKLVDSPSPGLRDRSHFLALASRVMRHLLVDHARARRAARRGSGQATVELDPLMFIPQKSLDAFTDLDEALRRLETMDPRQSRILEQQGGLASMLDMDRDGNPLDDILRLVGKGTR